MVLGRRELSAILLAVAAILFYLMLLSTTPSGAQTGGNEGCSNPEPVDTFSGTENQITPDFEITGNTFRLSYDITDLNEDPGFDSFLIRAIDEEGLQVGDSVLVFDEGSDTVNILEGPGTFNLEIESDGFDYTVTVEDCVGTNQGNENQTTQNQTTRNPTIQNRTTDDNDAPQRQRRPQRERTRDVVNVPARPLPPSGGLPVYGVVGGFVLTGAGLLALGLVIRRRTQG